MYIQNIGAATCWVAVFSIAWMLEHSRHYQIRSAPDMNFFVWLTGVGASMFGTLLSLANYIAALSTGVLIILLALASWRSVTVREYMRTVLIMAVPGICAGFIGFALMSFGK